MYTVADIVAVHSSTLAGSTPPVESYDRVSPGWQESEHRVEMGAPAVEGGYWVGEPGSVAFDSWPYNELCVILSGRVAVEDSTGVRLEWGAGESFQIPQGFSGVWHTLEPTEKVFVGVTSA